MDYVAPRPRRPYFGSREPAPWIAGLLDGSARRNGDRSNLLPAPFNPLTPPILPVFGPSNVCDGGLASKRHLASMRNLQREENAGRQSSSNAHPDETLNALREASRLKTIYYHESGRLMLPRYEHAPGIDQYMAPPSIEQPLPGSGHVLTMHPPLYPRGSQHDTWMHESREPVASQREIREIDFPSDILAPVSPEMRHPRLDDGSRNDLQWMDFYNLRDLGLASRNVDIWHSGLEAELAAVKERVQQHQQQQPMELQQRDRQAGNASAPILQGGLHADVHTVDSDPKLSVHPVLQVAELCVDKKISCEP